MIFQSRPDIFYALGNTGSKGGENVEEYSCKTKIISGSGSLAEIGKLGSRRLMIVSDPFFEKNGVAATIEKLSGAEETLIYSGVSPDPTAQQVACAVAEIKAFTPDTVVALGGGSAMDCAKAMVFFSGLSLRFVAVPTTSGSGSEVTDFSIITHNGVKHPLIDPKLCPDMAILDSDLLKELPPGLIADTGFDVLSHALEAYVATDSGAITDALAADAFATAISVLPKSFQGDLSVRGDMHIASTMAGMAFTRAGLGLCHAMSHTLGGIFHIPHGRLNAILLPSVVECNTAAAAKKYANLARRAGISGAADTVAVRNLKTSLIRLRKELRLPGSLTEAGVNRAEISRQASEIVSATLKDPCCRTNPVPVTADLVRRVLKEVTGTG